MKNTNPGPIIISVIAGVFFSVSAAVAQDVGRAERIGEKLLSRHCAMCHAVGRSGTSPHREAPPFRTLSRRYPIESLAEALGEGLYTGHPDMPEFVFSPQQVGAILSYLRSIQER
jgi:mono/diheme cytochrome c family protein